VVAAFVDGQDSIIASGLARGERVVTDGQLRLLPGARVEIKTSAPAPAGSTSG
jgi:multidrug efflux system membrane fusion protein